MESFHFSDIKLFIASDDAAEILQIGDNIAENTTQPNIPLNGQTKTNLAFIYQGRPVVCRDFKSSFCQAYEISNNSWISGINYGFDDLFYPATCYINQTHFWVAGGKVPGATEYSDSSITIDAQGFVFPRGHTHIIKS